MTTQSLESRVRDLELLVSQLNTSTGRELRYGQPDIRPALGSDLTAETAARIAADSAESAARIAGDAAIVTPLRANPSSVLTKNNDTTLASVPGMTISLAASSKYAFFMTLHYISTSAGDLKFDLGPPASATGMYWMSYLSTASVISASFFSIASTPVAIGGNGGSEAVCSIQGTILTSSADTIQVHAAQNTGDVSNTTIALDSFIIAWKLPN